VHRGGRRQKAEGRRQKAEGRRQKAEGRRQKAEHRTQNTEHTRLIRDNQCAIPGRDGAIRKARYVTT
jgi:hypothetical protein